MTAREWGAYPIIKFPDVPKIDVLMLPRQDQPPLGVGESASVPSAAAIANAIFDATGVRFRELPFTPERILKGLRGEAAGDAGSLARAARPRRARQMAKSVRRTARRARERRGAVRGRRRHRRRRAAVARDRADRAARCVGLFRRDDRARPAARGARRLRGLPHRRERRRSTPAAGALETPFGIIYSTNITPDVETGIGAWSYPAFERAMREGIHRDGRHLYPAFPYTHFAKTTDADLQALYAYLMAQPPVRAETPANALAFPFNLRPLMAGWNALFHQTAAHSSPIATKSEMWNRGAYLVEGLGHCGACHSPRNALGAEKQQRLSRRRLCRRLGSAGADLAVAGADPLERGRAVTLICGPANPAFTASPPGRWRRW